MRLPVGAPRPMHFLILNPHQVPQFIFDPTMGIPPVRLGVSLHQFTEGKRFRHQRLPGFTLGPEAGGNPRPILPLLGYCRDLLERVMADHTSASRTSFVM